MTVVLVAAVAVVPGASASAAVVAPQAAVVAPPAAPASAHLLPATPEPAWSSLPPSPSVPVTVEPVAFDPGARDSGGVRQAGGVGALRLVAVTWTGPSPDSVVLRSTDATGRWGAWTTLDPAGSERDDSEHDSTATRADRGGTDPVWVGERNAVEVRALRAGAPVTDRTSVVRIDPGTSANDRALGERASGGQALGGQAPGDHAAGRAGRAPGPPPWVSRAQWGADERLMTWPPVATPATRAVTIHHTAESNDYGPADSPAIVRGIYAYHARVQNWGDIGYNALVDRFGTVFEGRAGGLDRAVTAAHVGGFNEGTFGIAMMGDLSATAPSPRQFDAVAALAAWKLAPTVRDPDQRVSLVSAGGGTARYPKGATAVVPAVFAHRDVGLTVCPGDAAYGAMGALRARVRGMIASPAHDARTDPGSDPRSDPRTP